MEPRDELPDVGDGLNDFQRRSLRAIWAANGETRAATVLGLGGTSDPLASAFDFDETDEAKQFAAVLELAQEWRTRYCLIEGEGNIGSSDDASTSHPWYVDVAITPVGTEALGETRTGRRPTPLFPTLLVNGSRRGLARFPPHNLVEIVAAITARLDDPSLDVDGLMQHIPGPDFPTGGLVIDDGSIRESYARGRGAIRVRARTRVHRAVDGAASVVVDELPFLVGAGGDSGLIMEIAELKHRHLLPQMTNLHFDGRRLTLQFKADDDVVDVLPELFRRSRLETELEVRALASVEGVPTTLTMMDLIDHYIDGQRRARRVEAESRPEVIDMAIRDELIRLAAAFPDARRTEIVASG